MVDLNAFFNLSYGLYIVSSALDGKAYGCVVNTLSQVTATPPKLSVAIHKDNFTTEIIKKSGIFSGAILAETIDINTIGQFGFKSGKDIDKFAGFATLKDSLNIPVLQQDICGYICCKVEQAIDIGTHIMFIGEVVEAKTLDKELKPMTYNYYHTVKKGQTPPKASSYKAEEKKGYRCKICGYVYEGEPLPKDFICPICKKGVEFFEKI